VSGSQAVVDAEQGQVVGDVPLTPIQRRFFATTKEAPQHYLQSRLFCVPAKVDELALRTALFELWKHHDSLRLSYPLEDGVRKARHLPAETLSVQSVLQRVGLGTSDERAWTEAMHSLIASAHGSLALERPLFKAIWFDRGDAQDGRLYVLIHHLNVDGISWRVLVEDLEAAYVAASAQRPPQLPPKTSSYKDWANTLARSSAELCSQEERKYWLEQASRAAAGWPGSSDERPDGYCERDAAECHVRLPVEVTIPLITQANHAYNSTAHELLIAALAWSLGDWTDERGAWVDLESHGRDERMSELDVSRTTGWFTAIYPAYLHAHESDARTIISRVKEQLRAIPNRGVGYGSLRYLENHPELAALNPAVKFNFFGHVAPLAGTLLSDAPERPVMLRGPAQRKSHVVELNAVVVGEELHLSWRYPAAMEPRVRLLVAAYEQRLREICEHCSNPDNSRLTASDVAEADLDDEELEELYAELGALV
jgi:non-ribosomal peptide synthase protein (TIGR01720 family)